MTRRRTQAKGSTGAWDEWMGIQLECQYEEDLTKQPEARVRWYEAAGGTTSDANRGSVSSSSFGAPASSGKEDHNIFTWCASERLSFSFILCGWSLFIERTELVRLREDLS